MDLKVDVIVRNMEATDRLNDYAVRKVSKLDRFLGDIDEARVDLSHVKSARNAADRHVAQVTLRGNRFILRPIDHIVDVLQRWRGGDVAARTNMGGRYGELGLVGASVDHLLDELDERRRQTEKMVEARKLMGRELAHRVKNTLSIVQAIARQTFGLSHFFSTCRIASLNGGWNLSAPRAVPVNIERVPETS